MVVLFCVVFIGVMISLILVCFSILIVLFGMLLLVMMVVICFNGYRIRLDFVLNFDEFIRIISLFVWLISFCLVWISRGFVFISFRVLSFCVFMNMCLV